jgi:hypothetical protein
MRRCFAIGSAVLACLLVAWVGAAHAGDEGKIVWQQGFEKGLGGAKTYFHGKGGAQSKLEIATEGAAEGKSFARVTLAGQRTLEGFSIVATGLRGGQKITVQAKVRGKGQIMLALNSGKWAYSKPLTLTDQWQTLSLSQATPEKARSMGLYFISPQKVQKGAVFEVDDIRAAESPSDKALEKSLPSAPLAQVAKAASPPTIDGAGEDPCWKQTVAIDDFLNFATAMPASQPTTARLAYDDKYLYILMTCQEPLLKTVEQRQSDVIAKVTQRDGKVLGDDSCLIFLQPDEAKQATYEFTVNTLGTLLDARMERDRLWETRDVKWNSSAKVAVKREDGYWTAEVAIPLADLGISKIKEGDQWRVGLDRIAQSRHELSSWQPTNAAGAHAPRELGILSFAAGPVGMTPARPLTQLTPGKNTIQVILSGGAAKGAEIFSSVSGTKGSDWETTFAAKAGAAAHEFEVNQTGDVAARWGVLEARTLRPIYLSPRIDLPLRSSTVTLNLSTSGPYQVVVNDRVVNRGPKAQARKVDIPLQQGVNVIAVRAESGSAKLSLESPGLERFASVWRMNDAATPKATDSTLDDRTWPIAQADKEGTIGSSGKAVVLRRTILWDQTHVWPLPRPAWFIAGNSTQQVSFTALGLKGRKLDHWTTYLAVPKGLKVMGSTGYYGNTVASQPTFNCTSAGDVTIDGQTLPLYTITADKPLLPDRHPRMSIFQVMLQIADAAGAKEGTSWTLHYWSSADDGTMIEPPQSFKISALPPLAGVQPKQFVFQLWGGALTAMDNEALRRSVLATAQAAGFNQITGGNRWTSDAVKQYGLKHQMLVNFQPWSINLAPFLEKNPDARLIDSHGRPSKMYMCMTLLLDKDWPEASKALAEKVKEVGADVVQYDYEFGPLSGPHSCYCDRCLAAFKTRAHLPADLKLTPQLIADRYRPQWEDFLAWRVSKLFVLMKQTVHEARPGTQFSLYSGYQSPTTISRYGIDWRYVGRMKAADIVGCGYGRSTRQIDDTLKALDGIPLILGQLLTPYLPDDLKPGTVATRAVILRRALDATAGVLVYERTTMDGRSWAGVAAVTRLVSAYEDLFTAPHDLQPIPGQNPDNVQVLKGKEVSLVCVMNDTAKPAAFHLQLPPELGAGKEFYSGQSVAAGAKVEPTVAPHDAVVYVLRR